MKVALDPVRNRVALVVEDDAAIRVMLRKILEHTGLLVIEAGNGRAAIQYLSEHTPDIVCLDLMLPELSGFDICTYMRQNKRFDTVPVLVISGRLLPEDQAQAQELGASGYLTKPFKPEQLRTSVISLLMARAV